jgi:signal transduction histidine kinase
MKESSSVAQTKSITRIHLQRVLLVGLSVSALLLFSALLLAFRTMRQIDRNAALFAEQQALAKAAISNIEKQRSELNARWLRLNRRKDVATREEILAQLEQNQAEMSSALDSAYGQAEQLRQILHQEGRGLVRWTIWLFAACVVLSLICAVWVVNASTGLFRRLEQQSSELASMQYQLLETQEAVMRRFSHELHDELGQALTAVKANLSALRAGGNQARVEDCLALVDQAIKNVRELSQLLRPTILDDFGLDAALHSLAESFSERTGIRVQYNSDLGGHRRLRDETETHLYRIAQEALTNVARHSQATFVSMELRLRNDEVLLTIRDNGCGFDLGARRANGGLGLAGIEMRARGCGGTFSLETGQGRGVKIEVKCPNA